MTRIAIALLTTLAALEPANAVGIKVTGVRGEGTMAALLTPDKPRGAIILMAGGNGRIGVRSNGTIKKQRNQLVRTRAAYAGRGFAVLVPEGNVNVAAAVKMTRKFGPVTLVGTSRGTQRAACGIAAGARPARLVLTAGFLSNASGDTDNVISILGSPSRLPPTLVIHHRNDQCKRTRPAGVDPFIAWSKGKARVGWLTGGKSKGRFCKPRSHHGFNGIDGAVVSAVSGFAAR